MLLDVFAMVNLLNLVNMSSDHVQGILNVYYLGIAGCLPEPQRDHHQFLVHIVLK